MYNPISKGIKTFKNKFFLIIIVIFRQKRVLKTLGRSSVKQNSIKY